MGDRVWRPVVPARAGTEVCGLCDPPRRIAGDSVDAHLKVWHPQRWATLKAAGRRAGESSEEEQR
jgi:hypothetical protein